MECHDAGWESEEGECSVDRVTTKTEQHPLTRAILGRCPGSDPGGEIEVVVDFDLCQIAEH